MTRSAAAMTHLLSILLWVPAATALGIGLLDARRERLIRTCAIVSASLTAILAALLWFSFQPRGGEWQFVEQVNWLPSVGSSYSVGIDGFGLSLVALTAIVGLATVLSFGEIAADRARVQYAATLTLQFALFGAFVSLDLLHWFAFVAIALVTTALMARRAGALPRFAAWPLFLASGAAVLILAGILDLYFSHRTLSGFSTFDLRVFQHAAIPAPTQTFICTSLVLGFAIAAGLFPFQKAGALVLLNLGLSAFIRINLPVLPDASRAFGTS